MLEYLHSLWQHIPSSGEFVSAFPVILSLILIEGLLSVDNAMAIAAMASGLPKHQQKLALRLGIIGAYVFRGICMLLVGWIASNMWLKVFGAVYLIYLATEHLVKGGDEEEVHTGGHKIHRGLLVTVIQIEIMDLSLSLDNVVAAVALDRRLWVICLGVFIGILALRFVAGHCIKLIERFPVLKQTAFLLVGFVGVILVAELAVEHLMGGHFHIDSIQKFIGIVLIVALSLWYSETSLGKAVLGPIVKHGFRVLKGVDKVLSVLMFPLTWSVGAVKKVFTRNHHPVGA